MSEHEHLPAENLGPVRCTCGAELTMRRVVRTVSLSTTQMRVLSEDSLAYLRAVYEGDSTGAQAVYDTQDDPERLTLSITYMLAGAIRAAGNADETWEQLRRRAEDIR